MKKAIVTGSTGFIGNHLVYELLENSVEVIAVVRHNSNNKRKLPINVRIVECDLKEIKLLPNLIKERDIDVIFHIAWQGVSGKDASNQDIQIVNLVSTLDLIDVAREMEIKTFVGCGSMHEVESIIEMQEHKVINNLGYMYKTSKIAAHWMTKAKAGKYGIRFFWPLINTYGEEEKSPRLINTVIRKIFRNEIPELSDGNQYYDFVHVSDVAYALYLIAEKGIDGSNYIITSGEVKPLKEFLKIVGNVANEINDSNIPLGFGKIKNNVIFLPKEIFEDGKLTKDTGFHIKINFLEGIRRTALWIKENQ